MFLFFVLMEMINLRMIILKDHWSLFKSKKLGAGINYEHKILGQKCKRWHMMTRRFGSMVNYTTPWIFMFDAECFSEHPRLLFV